MRILYVINYLVAEKKKRRFISLNPTKDLIKQTMTLLLRRQWILLRRFSAQSSDGSDTNKPPKQRATRRINSSLKVTRTDTQKKSKIQFDYKNIFAIPLAKRPLFPGFYKSMYIKEPLAIQAVQSLWAQNRPYIGIFLAKNGDPESDIVRHVDEVEKVGVFAEITNIYQASQDNTALTVVVYPHRRILLKNVTEAIKSKEDELVEHDTTSTSLSTLPSDAFDLNHIEVPIATVENLLDEPYEAEDQKIKAMKNEVVNTLKEISQLNPLLRDQIITMSVQTGDLILDAAKLADFAAAVSSGEASEMQGVLNCLNIEERLNLSLIVLKKELSNCSYFLTQVNYNEKLVKRSIKR
jgi:Lon-like ATP-dependent protease